jgi:signal peptidase I
MTMRKKRNVGIVVLFLLSIFIVIVSCPLSIVALYSVVSPVQVVGNAMSPNYKDGDMYFISKYYKDLQRGDVIVFAKLESSSYIHRVIGLPGEVIKIQDCGIYINGEIFKEDYLPKDVCTNSGDFVKEAEEIIVPNGQYFVLGDNRSNSLDSRYNQVRFVSREDVKGVVFLRYYESEKK